MKMAEFIKIGFSTASLCAMSDEMSFEEEMEDEILTDEAEAEFMSRHTEGYRKTLDEFHTNEDEKNRFFDMSRAAVAAYMLGSYDEARKLAYEMDALPRKFAGTWNDGNLKYYSNWIFGMLELDVGNVGNAKCFLLHAGACGGSPQLNSFGPNMRLAKRLLARGEKEVFIEFLSLVETFWRSGGAWLRVWRDMTDANKTPNCLMHIF